MYEIKPFYGMDVINRDIHHRDVVLRFPDCNDFMKSPFSSYVTSSILKDKIHVFYYDTGFCKGFEVFPGLNISYKGFLYSKLSLVKLLNYLIQKTLKKIILDFLLKILVSNFVFMSSMVGLIAMPILFIFILIKV